VHVLAVEDRVVDARRLVVKAGQVVATDGAYTG